MGRTKRVGTGTPKDEIPDNQTLDSDGRPEFGTGEVDGGGGSGSQGNDPIRVGVTQVKNGSLETIDS